MSESNGKKILVIRLSSLGDILLTFPLLSLIKQKENNAELHFVVKEKFADAVSSNRNVDHTIIYKHENASEIKSLLKRNNYDLIIDLQNNLRSRLLTSFINKKIAKFKKPTLKKILLTRFKINLLDKNFSIAKEYIKTIYPNSENEDLPLYFDIPAEIEIQSQKKIPEQLLSKNIIGICPGSKHFTKQYPVEFLREVITKLISDGLGVAILGGKEDYEICKALEFKNNNHIVNFQNDDYLLETASIMKVCSAVITNDSGLMHLASLLQIPTVAIFGSTVREFGFAPLFNKSIIVENKDLSCRPCSHIGRNKCPKKHLKCLLEIKPETVYQKVIELLKN